MELAPPSSDGAIVAHAAASSEVHKMFISGFASNPCLNGEYLLDMIETVDKNPTYWMQDRSHFMFCPIGLPGKWQIAPRYCRTTQQDLLEDARRGGHKGLALQVDPNIPSMWQEIDMIKGVWVHAAVNIMVDRGKGWEPMVTDAIIDYQQARRLTRECAMRTLKRRREKKRLR
eukprot:TRINITY_DN7319_c1_g1_i2.p1 TRINITY_DN7319_c1_g1~~TRINITY_DN7319_c1_g1_i2.p1  ORF type:complete len:181 (-),score=28.24 TRINITY_DN7319_c1_g1_i2:42-560(-)